MSAGRRKNVTHNPGKKGGPRRHLPNDGAGDAWSSLLFGIGHPER
jgi:hypothetical protein